MTEEMPSFDIDEVLSKEPTSISPEEKSYLGSNISQMTSYERTRFGFDTPTTPTSPTASTPTNTTSPTAGEDDLADEDKQKIGKLVSSYTEPLAQANKQLKQENEMLSLFQDNPDAKIYRDKIKEQLALHPTIGVKQALTLAMGDDLLVLGARKEREAQRKANSTLPVGNGYSGSVDKPKDWANMSDEEFMKERNKVLGRIGI